MIEIQIPKGKKAYFASDFHLGFPNPQESRLRERNLMAWLGQVEKDGSALFLLGDLFDFWFEYSEVVPKGFVRFLGKLGEFSDRGIEIHIWVGNHDLWMFDYFENEISAHIYRSPQKVKISTADRNYQLFMGHGDGLGPGDVGYKLLKKIFVHPLSNLLFKILHPDLGVKLAHFWSNTRKTNTISLGEVPFDPKTDFILSYIEGVYQQDLALGAVCDAYIMGHRHHPIEYPLGEKAKYFNLGDWFSPDFKNAYYISIDENNLQFNRYLPV